MKNKDKANLETAVTPVVSQPENSFELINKYGTYEIQPTCDSDNKYPEIAQGRPKGRTPGDERSGIIPENAAKKHIKNKKT